MLTVEGSQSAPAASYRHTPGTAGRVIDGKAAIVTRDNKLHILNGVGTRVWQLCEQRATEPDIVRTIVAEFEVDEPTAEKDCEKFLADLLSRGIVVREEGT